MANRRTARDVVDGLLADLPRKKPLEAGRVMLAMAA
jgi:hypothetical protein